MKNKQLLLILGMCVLACFFVTETIAQNLGEFDEEPDALQDAQVDEEDLLLQCLYPST